VKSTSLVVIPACHFQKTLSTMSSLLALEVILIIISTIGFLVTFTFIIDQARRIGCAGLFDSKMSSVFVLLGLVVSTIPIFDAVKIAMDYGAMEYTFPRYKGMKALSTIFFLTGIQCHIALLHLRTDKILIPEKMAKPVRILMIVFFVFAWLHIFTDIAWDFAPDALNALYWITGMIAALSFVTIDIMFNTFFARFVWQTNRIVHKAEDSTSKRITTTIAKSGFIITTINVLAFVLYIGIIWLETWITKSG
jgi:hypothetical protein